MTGNVFHWSPTERRRSIARDGLLPHSLSTDGLWRPPYICLADDPGTGWELSGRTARGRQVASWDLWVAALSSLPPHEEVPFENSPRVKERRVYVPVAPELLWRAGTRAGECTTSAEAIAKMKEPAA